MYGLNDQLRLSEKHWVDDMRMVVTMIWNWDVLVVASKISLWFLMPLR